MNRFQTIKKDGLIVVRLGSTLDDSEIVELTRECGDIPIQNLPTVMARARSMIP